MRERAIRALWVVAGAIALALGVVGLFLPLVPTVPFVLLASFCLVRGSPALHERLLAQPRFGPLIRDWEAGRGIPRRAKATAITMIVVSFSISAWWIGRPLIAGVLAVAGLAVIAYLLHLPTPERRNGDAHH